MWADTARQDDNLGKRFRTYLREKVRKVEMARIDRQIARQGRRIGVLLMQERDTQAIMAATARLVVGPIWTSPFHAIPDKDKPEAALLLRD